MYSLISYKSDMYLTLKILEKSYSLIIATVALARQVTYKPYVTVGIQNDSKGSSHQVRVSHLPPAKDGIETAVKFNVWMLIMSKQIQGQS